MRQAPAPTNADVDNCLAAGRVWQPAPTLHPRFRAPHRTRRVWRESPVAYKSPWKYRESPLTDSNRRPLPYHRSRRRRGSVRLVVESLQI